MTTAPSPHVRVRSTLRGHTDIITAIRWSPDGRYLATASKDGTVRIWDSATDALLQTLAHPDGEKVYSIAWSPDGQRLASGSSHGFLRIWNPWMGEVERHIDTRMRDYFQRAKANMFREGEEGEFNYPEALVCIIWFAEGSTIATASWFEDVTFWNIRSLRQRRPIAGKSRYYQDDTAIEYDSSGMATSHTPPVYFGKKNHSTLLGNADYFKRIVYHGLSVSMDQSTDKKYLVSSSRTRIMLWNTVPLQNHSEVIITGDPIIDILWFKQGGWLVIAGDAGSIQLWDIGNNRKAREIEGHVDAITSISFSADERLLASRSIDNSIRIWRCDTWETVAIFEEEASGRWFSRLAFHPSRPLLAVSADGDQSVRIFTLDEQALWAAKPIQEAIHYTNAKVVLVGDSGVGKSGLGLVLSDQPFEPTDSTHGRRVWGLPQRHITRGGEKLETEEILLWDLAGQPGYRLVHQLHLNEVAIALIVFDSRSEIDPFAGVRYWDRALRLAQRVHGGVLLKKILVAARVDRGGIPVSRGRIDALISDVDAMAFIETSAREGWGIEELQQTIKANIDWDSLPRISSTLLFHQIKAFLIAEKESGRLLSPAVDLYQAFLRTRDPEQAGDFQSEFSQCLGRLEARGLIRRLSFGDLVLLQPELLDAYASAIIMAAKNEPDGLGCIAEEDAQVGRFPMSKDERVDPQAQEKLLVLATIEELLRHEIALPQDSAEGTYLVFPSQFTRDWPDAPDPQDYDCVFAFEGAILNIYATLAVRLSRSGIFRKHEMWKNAAIYTSASGGRYGIFLKELGDGAGQLILFYDQQANPALRLSFEDYIKVHLVRRALSETLVQRRYLRCTSCGMTLPEQQVQFRLSQGRQWITCGFCDAQVSLVPAAQPARPVQESQVPAMDAAADRGRNEAMLKASLDGRRATDDYDFFLCYSQLDQDVVDVLDQELQLRGVLALRYPEDELRKLERKLFKTLAHLYPATAQVQRIANAVGLAPQHISLGDRAIDAWASAVSEAGKHQKLSELILLVREEYPENTELPSIQKRLLAHAPAVLLLFGSGAWSAPGGQAQLRAVFSAGRKVLPVVMQGRGAKPILPTFLHQSDFVALSEGWDEATLVQLLRRLLMT